MSRFLGFILCIGFALTAHATDWSKKLPLEHKSRYFDFHYQRATWNAAGFARFADGFVELVDRDFIKVEFDYPIQVLVLPDRASFQHFLKAEFRVSDPPDFGIYFPAFKVFATYENSGFGTFAHEIMHPFVHRDLPNCPMWASEAIPAFFEKFIGYWDGDRLRATWGYQNPWRIDAIGDQLTKLDLTRILADRRPVTSFNNSERRLVTVFLWQHGRLERFLQAIAHRDRGKYDSYFEAAMDQPLKAILPLWNAYLTEIATHRADVMRVPISAVFPDRASYEAAMAAYKP